MRILVATDHWFPDHRGGAARVAAETAALFAARGHAVEALAPLLADGSREVRSAALSGLLLDCGVEGGIDAVHALADENMDPVADTIYKRLDHYVGDLHAGSGEDADRESDPPEEPAQPPERAAGRHRWLLHGHRPGQYRIPLDCSAAICEIRDVESL